VLNLLHYEFDLVLACVLRRVRARMAYTYPMDILHVMHACHLTTRAPAGGCVHIQNGDGALSMQEFVDAFSAGVAQAKLEDASPAPASSQQQQQGAVNPSEFRFAEVSTESKEKARGN